MREIKRFCLIAVLGIGVLSCGTALADRHHGDGHIGLGFYFGAPYFSPYPYYPPYYPYPYYAYPYSPPVVVAPASPPEYIERNDQQSASPQQENYFWYHCDNPEGYYPYIKQCPGGWQQVKPEPPKE